MSDPSDESRPLRVSVQMEGAERPNRTLQNMERSFADTGRSERSAEEPVSDHPPPETPTHAARVLIGWFAGGLAFQCVENLHNGYWPSLGYGIGAVAVAIFDYKLPAILAGSPRLTKSLNDLAADARLWVAVAMLSLLIIALSPYFEQRRLPYAWQFAASQPPATAPPPSPIQEQLEAANKTNANLRAALEDMTRQRDAALKQNPPQPLPPPSPVSGPVTWDADLSPWSTGDSEGPLLLGIAVRGSANGFVDLKDAYIISDVTGEKKTLQVSTAPGPVLSPISEINQIPPGARVDLWATFKPAVRPNDLLIHWHRFHFHAEYSGIVYDRVFDLTRLINQFPNTGPHVTKKVPAQ